MEHLTTVSALIESLSCEFTALADSVWDEPELRWQEELSVGKQIAVAERHGFAVTRPIASIPTAFLAERGAGGPVIAFLGEYDALAGLSQASGEPERRPSPADPDGPGQGCGHHLLGSGSLLAAIATARHLEAEGIPGRVRYYGCPAEEAAAGKTFMVRDGAFTGVDAAVSWHPSAMTLARQTSSLAYTQAYFRYRGYAAHAAAAPHLGRSALDAVELLNIGVNFLREHMPDSARIHYALTDAGGVSPNVVQSAAEAYYIVRATDTRQMRELYERVIRVAEGAALMTGTELSVEFDGACAELLPNGPLEDVMCRVVDRLGGVPFDEGDHAAAGPFATGLDPSEIAAAKAAAGWEPRDPRTLHDTVQEIPPGTPRPHLPGSTDVGDVSWSVPTVQLSAATFALGTPFHSWQVVAQGKLPAAHKGMVHAAKAMAGTAVELFADTALLARASEEHARTLSLTPYVCPIPDEVLAPPLREKAQEPQTSK